MTCICIVLCVLVSPFVLYRTVKLVTYAVLEGRWQHEQDHLKES